MEDCKFISIALKSDTMQSNGRVYKKEASETAIKDYHCWNNELLFKDLSCRLPYGVSVHIINRDNEVRDVVIGTGNINYVKEIKNGWWRSCKPYLIPMSSIHKEIEFKGEKIVPIEELHNISSSICFDGSLCEYGSNFYLSINDDTRYFDYLNSHMIDYRGLIDNGLAIAVTPENNPYK